MHIDRGHSENHLIGGMGGSENIFSMAARLPDTSCAHEKVTPKYMKNLV
jgi:hypothetical protein